MSELLHIDTSLRTGGSVSREVTGAFARAWRAARPDAGYTYRDLAADPLPHVDPAVLAARAGSGDRSAEERLRAELLAADTLLIGAPMYNFGLPSTLKAWLDWVIVPELFVDQRTGEGLLVGKRVVVVTARGGSYSAGTPLHAFDFQEPYLRAVFSMIGLDRDLEFVHAEMTKAHDAPEFAEHRGHADASREDAHRAVLKLAAA
ncbi:FMN-dependent NADH-azoreductase [Saccharothrix longispora]|uniref:FMN dependent NADH:quinone oxidoreductase n=1 Tax=Saccharothrix longispora TaxID=33920 RepID=A0ABU1Q812_9PSEU|nr:NAD(P)H-dependent oxidoreductase [Saccharothrix longispora]MDR6598554.1 FMN-dependent NADH-azoreductase [Saccharothrix longispora]